MQRIWLITVLSVAAACGNDSRREPAGTADRFPRLSHAQWEATVQDLFKLPQPPGLSSDFTPDPPLGRFDNNIARLTLGSGLWRGYQHAAEVIAERVAGDPALLAVVAPDRAADPRSIITAFGLRAYRRPLTEKEAGRYVELFASAAAVFPDQDPVTAGIRLVVQGMLQSPAFLYRSELSDVVVDYAIPLDGYEVASRLSYLFWNTMPDDGLFAAAKAGSLDSEAGVREYAAKMIDDPRTAAQFRRFHLQAFSMSDYGDLDKATSAFPDWRHEVGAEMKEEALRFVDDVFKSKGGVAELMTSTKAFVNADLAKIYGVPGTFGTDYTEVTLDPAKRAGLLTRAGFLAKNATLTDPDPIHRGVFINRNIICRTIAAPPVVPPALEQGSGTNREQITTLTGVGTCGEHCHATLINPIGFAFEGYDAVGAVRANDHGLPIDSSDSYTFESGRKITYGNAVELSKELAVSPEVHACYTAELLEFMLGRNLDTKADAAVVTELADRSLAEHLSIKELVLQVVTSRAFRVRALIKGSHS